MRPCCEYDEEQFSAGWYRGCCGAHHGARDGRGDDRPRGRGQRFARGEGRLHYGSETSERQAFLEERQRDLEQKLANIQGRLRDLKEDLN